MATSTILTACSTGSVTRLVPLSPVDLRGIRVSLPAPSKSTAAAAGTSLAASCDITTAPWPERSPGRWGPSASVWGSVPVQASPVRQRLPCGVRFWAKFEPDWSPNRRHTDGPDNAEPRLHTTSDDSDPPTDKSLPSRST
jgi:hypothetical protein